jgi:hypothetical protein
MSTASNVSSRLLGDLHGTITAQRIVVSATFFDALSVPVVEGRGFVERRDTAAAPPVVIVSREFSSRFLSGQAIGRLLRLGAETWTIIGVAGDVRWNGIRRPSRPAIYVHVPQAARAWYSADHALMGMDLLMTGSDVPARTGDVRALSSASGGTTVSSPVALDGIVGRDAASTRFLMFAAGLCSLLMITLSAVTTATSVAQHLAEAQVDFAIRAVLGAPVSTLRRRMLFVGLKPVVAGTCAGLLLGYVGGHLMRSHLFGFDGIAGLLMTEAAAVVSVASIGAAALTLARFDLTNPLKMLHGS